MTSIHAVQFVYLGDYPVVARTNQENGPWHRTGNFVLQMHRGSDRVDRSCGAFASLSPIFFFFFKNSINSPLKCTVALKRLQIIGEHFAVLSTFEQICVEHTAQRFQQTDRDQVEDVVADATAQTRAKTASDI